MVEKIIGFFYIIFMREEITIEVKNYIKQVFPELKPIELYGGEEEFKRILENDERKRKLCEENGVKLLYALVSLV